MCIRSPEMCTNLRTEFTGSFREEFSSKFPSPCIPHGPTYIVLYIQCVYILVPQSVVYPYVKERTFVTILKYVIWKQKLQKIKLSVKFGANPGV